jgi:hypothetical protein
MKPKAGNAVYFIQDSGAAGEIKIGATAHDLRSRVIVLQLGNPRALRALGAIRFECREDAEEEEAKLLARFRGLHVRGKWFTPGAELIAYLRETFPDADVRNGAETPLDALRLAADAVADVVLAIERGRVLLGDGTSTYGRMITRVPRNRPRKGSAITIPGADFDPTTEAK